jgi:hypothetical protein
VNRRAFLASLGAAFTLDPERALWTPGAKTISIPSRLVVARVAWDRRLDLMEIQAAYTRSFDAWVETLERGERVRVLG